MFTRYVPATSDRGRATSTDPDDTGAGRTGNDRACTPETTRPKYGLGNPRPAAAEATGTGTTTPATTTDATATNTISERRPARTPPNITPRFVS